MNKVWFVGYRQSCWECNGSVFVLGPYATEQLADEALERYLRNPAWTFESGKDWRVFSEEVRTMPDPLQALDTLYGYEEDDD